MWFLSRRHALSAALLMLLIHTHSIHMSLTHRTLFILHVHVFISTETYTCMFPKHDTIAGNLKSFSKKVIGQTSEVLCRYCGATFVRDGYHVVH